MLNSKKKVAQLETIKAWMESARSRTYAKNDKRRFVQLEYCGTTVLCEPSEAYDWVADAEPDTYVISEKWMTQSQYQKLPDFEGF